MDSPATVLQDTLDRDVKVEFPTDFMVHDNLPASYVFQSFMRCHTFCLPFQRGTLVSSKTFVV
jgi:hypothetical protein